MYNSTASVIETKNGDWLLTYLKGVGHVSSSVVIMRRSHDLGKTWSPEKAYVDTSKPDPSLAKTLMVPTIRGKLGVLRSITRLKSEFFKPHNFFR